MLHVLFTPAGKIEQAEFLQLWKTSPAHGEQKRVCTMSLGPLSILRSALQAGCCFTLLSSVTLVSVVSWQVCSLPGHPRDKWSCLIARINAIPQLASAYAQELRGGIAVPSPEAAIQKLAPANVFLIARRDVDGAHFLYMSLKATTGVVVLLELVFKPEGAALSLCFPFLILTLSPFSVTAQVLVCRRCAALDSVGG
jgi:beta2-adaptin appendage-like protein